MFCKDGKDHGERVLTSNVTSSTKSTLMQSTLMLYTSVSFFKKDYAGKNVWFEAKMRSITVVVTIFVFLLINEHVLVVHKGIRNIKCKECDKTFANKSSLIRHKNTVHQQIKSAKCDDRGKMFGSNQKLNRHKNLVHDKKTFKCDPCGKQFTSKDNLRIHKRRTFGWNSDCRWRS